MQGLDRHFYEFDSFRVEVEERRLTRGGETVPLTAKAFDILLTLIANSGATVEKERLLQTVWNDTFVEESNLNHHISTLRKVLGDNTREQRYIKTIPKQGYRFTAKVREVEERDENVALGSMTRGRLVIREETVASFWSLPRVAIACGMLAAVVAGAFWLFRPETAVNAAARTEAVEMYKKGRELWQTRSGDDLHQATVLLEQAVEKDPGFALARAALADAYAFDYKNWKKAEAAAREAIRLDPALGQPHATIGFVTTFWEWKLAEAEGHFKKAVALSPDYPTARQWYALNLLFASRGDAALVEIEKALSLEPESLAIKTDYCQILYSIEKFHAAEARCQEALAATPQSETVRNLLYQISMSRGADGEAVERFAALLANSRNERIADEAPKFRQAYAEGGIEGFRRAQIAYYTNVDPSFYKLARVLAEIGDIDAAVASLRNAVDRRDFDMVFYAADPAFRNVRTSNLRFGIPGRPE